MRDDDEGDKIPTYSVVQIGMRDALHGRFSTAEKGKEYKQQNDTNTMVDSKYFCSSQITTCALIRFMHISCNVRRFGGIAYPMHVRRVFHIFLIVYRCTYLRDVQLYR